jgi:hypothetical protein
MDSISDYTFNELDDRTTDIRLITLLPDDAHSPIRVTISHVSLDAKAKTPWNHGLLNIAQLTETLPPLWEVHETIHEQYLFVGFDSHHDESKLYTSWKHPGESFDQTLYFPASPPSELIYEALSYTWGPDNISSFVLVETKDGPEKSNRTTSVQKLAITETLHEALLHLRRSDSPRTLWIDAICINQKDASERDEQVLRMGDIYRNAYRVVVWLGPERDNSKNAMTALGYLGQQTVLTRETLSAYPSPDQTEVGWWLFSTELPFAESIWDSISSLLHRAWFTRRWIVQEIQLATPRSVIRCGDIEISWPSFRAAGLHLYTYKYLRAELQRLLGRIFSICMDLTRRPLHDMLQRMQHNDCRDKRDMVYAMLGLLSPALAQRICPQYSLKVHEVYKSAFLANMEYTGRLDLFELCYLSARQVPGPSWVPDLGAPSPTRGVMRSQFSTGYSISNAVYDSGTDILTVQGTKCGQISHVSDLYQNDSGDLLRVCDYIRNWLSRVMSGSHMTQNRTTEEQIAMTMCFDGYLERHPDADAPTLEQWIRFFAPVCDQALRDEVDSLVGPNTRRMYHAKLLGHCFFWSELGMLGVGPPGTTKGVVLSSANTGASF